MPRTLAAALRPYVTAHARTRGQAYLRQGRVTIVHTSPTSVSARVRGSLTYEVSLTLTGELLQVGCTCPFFEGSSEPCLHIWALVLRADAGHLVDVPPNLGLDLGDIDGDTEDAFTVGHPSPSAETTTRRQRPAWETFLTQLAAPSPPPGGPGFHAGELVYVFDPVRSTTMHGMLVELLVRERRRNGGWTKPRTAVLTRGQIADLPDTDDRQMLERICGAQPAYGGNWDGFGATFPVPSTFVLTPALQRDLIPRLCASGRFLLRWSASGELDPPITQLALDDEPATFRLRVAAESGGGYTVDGAIEQGTRVRPLTDALFLTSAVVLWRPEHPEASPRLATFDAAGGRRWLAGLIGRGPVLVPRSGAGRLMTALATSDVAHADLPDELHVETRVEAPLPIVRLTRPPASRRTTHQQGRLGVEVGFAYGDIEVASGGSSPIAFDATARIAWRRDHEAERAALTRLLTLGVRRVADWEGGGRRLEVAETTLPAFVRALVADGWRVEADGRRYRRPGASTLGIRSGIDWFELHGTLAFDDLTADLPSVVAATKRGDTFVTLGDGSFGLLPDEWLARHARLAVMGAVEDDHVRFSQSQVALLDAWLAEQPGATWDATFTRHREELARFAGVSPEDAPSTFHGTLRDYQRDALGWFSFLRRFGFGGCLADEMGLGKTVMVLAALDSQRVEREQGQQDRVPSLIVVPRSLVFNWQQEAQRFAPGLRVLDATRGGRRRDLLASIGAYDVVLVTYGTLRRDIGSLRTQTFDYVVLDEAQAIKNATTVASKAVRLLSARHRLALSGTPVENHLGELWSLFDFLNPGLLGTSTAFAATGVGGRSPDGEMLGLLARGLRPFILRRTKEQVATELPPRTEQTIFCDLEPAQRRVYDSLRHHYRAALLGARGQGSTGHSTLQLLEALLRLRQAACHPALVDPVHADGPSAKLDVLVPRLQELVEDGRSVLVFSQFTSLLALVRTRLDAAALAYEYLDGRTRNRAARVQRFQEGACPIFLISLKAGGVGLNLTAADSVFLLDPWWNPAVEAQAIDRAHRIGQTRSVFAYRLIARDTIEEKVLELQQSKRQLADAVVQADASLLRELRREDLELLLS